MTKGVYSILCRRTGYRYVGSSARSIENRWSHHIALLNSKEHSSPTMQRHWDRYGVAGFTFAILRVCETREECIQLEAEELTKGGRLYNIWKTPTGRGQPRTQETRAKQSERARERNARPEYKAMLVARAKAQHAARALGRRTWSEEAEKSASTKLRAKGPQTSKRVKAMWADPETRAKISAKRWTPERRAEQAERIRNRSKQGAKK